MSKKINRRTFVKRSALAGFTILASSSLARSYEANSKLRTAQVGCGGRGNAHIGSTASGEPMGLCDVDPKEMKKAIQLCPNAPVYTDYRKMFDDLHGKVDAAFVATPDHNHFSASMWALEAGAGVYTEKPLTYSVWEARRLAEFAREKNKVKMTQLGNQSQSGDEIRQLVEMVWHGAIGPVTEAHVWLPAKGWAHEKRTEPSAQPVPNGFDWECWLGPAPYRGYSSGIASRPWHAWCDYGTGLLGDMGCHRINDYVWALKLTEAEAVEVEAETTGCTLTYPLQSTVTYRFPARADMPPCKLVWYDGRKPDRPEELEADREWPNEGMLLVGEKGKMLNYEMIPEARMKEYEMLEPTLPRSPHGYKGDFMAACRGENVTPSSNFDVGGPLTELVLLGNVAIRCGEPFSYRIKEMEAVNCPEADALIKREPRKGWEFGYA